MAYEKKTPMQKKRKVVIPNKIRKKPGVKKGKLTDSQEKALKAHSKKHSKDHIKYMTILMRDGVSFSAAHKKAMTDKGK